MSDDEATVGHNSGERAAAIADGLREMYALDGEIAAIVERDIKELRASKSAIKDSLRERFNLTSRMIQARYYSYKIEREAVEASDDLTLQAIRELYEVLPVGGTVDLIEAVEKAAE
jgi:hypothetical protein